MRSANSQPIKILGLALMLVGTNTTFGDETVDLRVYNDTAEEIVVTLYDMNAIPPEPVLVRQIIEGFAWVPASVTPGIEGDGHVSWSAETTGTSFHRCGHQERRGLTSDATVRVFTDSRCVNSEP
jgi:hypothetical protein